MSQELSLLKNIEDKLQNIKDFNTCFASYQEDIKYVFFKLYNESKKFIFKLFRILESWLENGRERLNALLKPDKDLLPEERVMLTMELQSDIEQKISKMKSCEEIWKSIAPEADEVSDKSQVINFNTITFLIIMNKVAELCLKTK